MIKNKFTEVGQKNVSVLIFGSSNTEAFFCGILIFQKKIPMIKSKLI